MAAFIMSGRMQAILFTLSVTLMSFLIAPLGVLGNAAIALVTLRLGVQQGLLVALPAAVGLTLVIALLKGDVWVGFVSGLVSWLPIIALGAVLSKTVSWTAVLQYMLAILVGLIVLFHLLVGGDTATAWEGWLNTLANMLDFVQDAEQKAALSQVFTQAAPYMTGMMAALVGIHWIVSLMIGRHWQAQLYNPGGFQQELHQIRVSKPVALFVLVLIGITLLTQSALTRDIVLASMSVFLFAGLSLAHYSVKTSELGIVWLVSLYILLLIMPTYTGILLATFGLIDSQANFRSYLKARQP